MGPHQLQPRSLSERRSRSVCSLWGTMNFFARALKVPLDIYPDACEGSSEAGRYWSRWRSRFSSSSRLRTSAATGEDTRENDLRVSNGKDAGELAGVLSGTPESA